MPVSASEASGFNVIGYVSANIGLGVAARNLIAIALGRGFPVAIHDLDPGLGRQGANTTYRHLNVDSAAELPFGINIFVLEPSSLTTLLQSGNDDFFRADRLNVAFPFWELPRLPARWVPVMNLFDVIAAASESMKAMFQFAVSGPLVVSAHLPAELPDGVTADRRRFDLPEDATVFVSSFEPHSDPTRKNPMAVLDAFIAGVGDDARCWLVLKANNVSGGITHPIMAELRDRCGNHPRIRIIDAAMTYPEVLSLYKTCDAFVSLHRAEGLGLALMESMALGKPVIATAWSGNMTFMHYTNACLVRYDLVPVESKIPVYSSEVVGPGVTWAAPRIADAAAWMRRLANDRGLRDTISANAARDMKTYSDEARAGGFLDGLIAVRRDLSAFDRMTPDQARSALVASHEPLNKKLTTRRLRSELEWVIRQALFRTLSTGQRLGSKVVRSLRRDGR